MIDFLQSSMSRFARAGLVLPIAILLAVSGAVAGPLQPPALESWPPPSDVDLPAGVLARVEGQPLTFDQLHERLVQERGHTEEAGAALQQLLDTKLVEQEMKRRGVAVEAAEVEAKLSDLNQRIESQSGGTMTLEEVLTQRGVSLALFREQLEYLVGLEKLAREDFGLGKDEAISESKTNLWLAELRDNASPEVKDLPEGVIVKTRDFSITTLELGAALARVEDPAYLKKLVRAMISERLIQASLDAESIEVTQEALDQELEFRRSSYERAEQFPGVAFEQYIEATQGMPIEQHKASTSYRYQTGAKLVAKKLHPKEERRAYYEENKPSFGPLRRVRHLLISTRERSDEEAVERIDQIREELDAGVPFSSLVQSYTEESAPGGRRDGDTGYFTPNAKFDEEFLEAAFALEPGKFSAPVKTSLGYHILQVIGVKPLPSFEEADGMIIRRLTIEWLEARRQAADVEPGWIFPDSSSAATSQEGAPGQGEG